MSKVGKPEGLKNYTEEEKDMIMEYIFDRIESGKSLFDAIKDDKTGENMISLSTFSLWLTANLSYSSEYSRVKTVRHDRLAENTMIVASTPLIATRTVESEKGVFVTTYDNVDRSRLMINSSQWYLEKLDSGRFGKNAGENQGGHVEQELFPDLHNDEEDEDKEDEEEEY